MTPAIFTILRLVTAALLFWALGKHSHNYYVLLRWLVFLTGAWGAYRSYQETFDKWFFVVFHLALVVLFNPLLPFTFERSFWNFLNVVAGLVIFMSIFIIDSSAVENFLESKSGSAFGFALGSVWSIGLSLLGIFIIYLSIDGIM